MNRMQGGQVQKKKKKKKKKRGIPTDFYLLFHIPLCWYGDRDVGWCVLALGSCSKPGPPAT